MTILDYVLYIALTVGVLLVIRSTVGAPRTGDDVGSASPGEAGAKRRQSSMKAVALGTAVFALAIIGSVVFVLYGFPLILDQLPF